MGSFPMGAWLGEEIETERRKFEVLREEKAEMEMENEPWPLVIRPWYESWVSPSPVRFIPWAVGLQIFGATIGLYS